MIPPYLVPQGRKLAFNRNLFPLHVGQLALHSLDLLRPPAATQFS